MAVLWGRKDPLAPPAEPNRNNKILSVSKLPVTAGPDLYIRARALTELHPYVL